MDDNIEVFDTSNIDEMALTVREETQEIIWSDVDVEASIGLRDKLLDYVRRAMIPDVDYGIIPGTLKPTLYQPGAQKLAQLFGLRVLPRTVDIIEQWDVPVTAETFPLFMYRMEAQIYKGDHLLYSGQGSCNSYEDRYHWRNVPVHELSGKWRKAYDEGLLDVKEGTAFEYEFALNNRETTGKYGKPEEYWNMFQEEIAAGRAVQKERKSRNGNTLKGWEINTTVVLVPSENIYTQVNTILKIAEKRTVVDAVLYAVGASQFFSQADDLNEQEPELSIYTFVPSPDAAKRALIAYVGRLGIENPTQFIRQTLEGEQLLFSLDQWEQIVSLVENMAKEIE